MTGRTYPQRIVVPLLDRILAKLNVGLCWEFTGAIHKRTGYGIIQRGRRTGTTVVHKALWELLVGPVPEGLDLDHLCRNRQCCNPDHLQPVTRQINVERGAAASGLPRRTACINGHVWTPETEVIQGRQRICRICRAKRNREYRARLKAAA